MNKNRVKFVIIIVVILIDFIYLYVLKYKRDYLKENTVPNEFVITYKYGGGYTTYANQLERYIMIDHNGDVVIELTDPNIEVDPMLYSVSRDKARELVEYLIKNNFKNIKEDLSNNNITDMSNNYINLQYPGYDKTVGGYGSTSNKRFSKYVDKFIETVGKDKIEEFKDRVKEYIENEGE